MEEKQVKSKSPSKLNAFWQKFLSLFKKDQGPRKVKPLKVHSRMHALIAVQYRDKIDTSWTKSFKTISQKIVFMIIKFVLLFIVVYFMLIIIDKVFVVGNSIMRYYLVFLGFYTILNLFTVTFGLVKSLYHAEDNKVLATYPTTSTRLFFTKILVYELFELKKSFDILLPITLAFLFTGVSKEIIPKICLVWALIPFVLVLTITVLVGALLSIPALFIYNFIKRHPLLEGGLLVLIASAVVVGLVYVISLIPSENISIQTSYALIKEAIDNFIVLFSKIVYPIHFAYRAMTGESVGTLTTKLTWVSFGRVGIMIGVAAALLGLVFLIIKPFYFKMMTRTFEFEKQIVDSQKKNKVRERHWAFVLKEIKLTLRDFEVSGSYLGVYIAVPILLLLIDKVFAAMSTSLTGDVMVAAFNIMLILLPLLASSTVVATVYSREGRTAYIKKTKPIRPYFPLTSKILFNLVFVIPSICVSCFIFTKFTSADSICGILLGITVLCVEYAHIFFSASLDIMNPQNEVYATEGTSISNPNERKSTIIGFIFALAFGALGLIFLMEGKPLVAYIKLLILGVLLAVSCITLFFLKVKAFYLDRQEASRD